MNILGVNFFHANAAAAVFTDGKLVAAAEEERFNRVKFSAGIPVEAVGFCLRQAGLSFRDIDVITYPRTTNTRVVNNDQIHFQDRIYRISSLYDRYRINLKLINFKETLARHFDVPVETLVFKLQETDHHLSHMLSGFFYSPFDEALILSCDAFGDFVSLKAGVGRGRKIEVFSQVDFPHSLGLFYTMVTQFLGFPGYGDESKVMGLSTFGYPEYTDRLRTIISTDDGKVRLNLKYFDHESGVGTSWGDRTPDISRLYNNNLAHLIGAQRQPEEEITPRHQNIAASTQLLTEGIVVSLIESLYARHPIPNLVLTGGLAYNALLNARIPDETAIEEIYVPPSPGNSGLCIGSALALLGDQAPREEMRTAFWGPEFSDGEVRRLASRKGIAFEQLDDPPRTAAALLHEGRTLGWFQGRMEFGPRSLGARCILVNPLAPDPRRVKRRHHLKPLGISILEPESAKYMYCGQSSPFMSFMARIRGKRRREFETVLLNDYCRYQTVGTENPRLQRVLTLFQEKTNLPFVINTSLNVEGEPIIESPTHLLDDIGRMGLDAAIVGDVLIIVPNPRP
jgi:carbamoyltransferase